ncbi:MAG: DUF1553 domain-containing protein [Planctomycetota bacterium]|nr:DUF1553 domain-containing protein [Planctomycetota bacterium]
MPKTSTPPRPQLGRLSIAIAFMLVCTSPIGAVALEGDLDFSGRIRPLLASRCFNCHGPDPETREAGLRLDTQAGALALLESGDHAIIAGNSKESEILHRVQSRETGYRMPPEDAGEPLSEEEISLLRAWIDAGAVYDTHWSFVPPKRPAIPTEDPQQWSTKSLDRLVLESLHKAELAPNPRAKLATLARRISLDLIGIPPNPNRVQELVSDPRPDALQRYVDEVLASPAFGERWAAVWLDLARYADSQGYAQDSPRTIFRYRDWVIDALNSDMPFDEFTVQQIAGDMLNDPTENQLIATAFHRNTMTNSEGGTDNEEFRVAAVVDRVNTTMQVWMGMTMGCAQCHTHKYDPITQEEYYRFFAILNQTEDRDHPQEIPVYSSFSNRRLQERQQAQQQIKALEQKLAADPMPMPEIPTRPADEKLLSRYIRIQLLANQTFLSLAEVQAFAGDANVALKGKANQSTTAYEGPASLAIDGNTNGHYSEAKSTTHTDRESNPWWEVDLGSEHAVDRIMIWNRNDTPDIGERLKPFRVLLLDNERQPLWAGRFEEAPKPSLAISLPATWSARTDASRKEVEAYLLSPDANPSGDAQRLAQLQEKLKNLREDITTPIMRQLPEEKQRDTFIHLRGNFRTPGDAVSPGLPSAFHDAPKTTALNRLDLAKWLVAPGNPLTARVIANRFWENLFGVGIVETSEDFGTQGSGPSNQRLLDLIASDFSNREWGVKSLLRDMVLSATYQQSSHVTEVKLEQDPYNQLLGRGPRFRLSAETIRDQALATAGLLSQKMHGPSVKPPRPNLGIRAAFGGSTDWQPSPGQDRFRRGLYTSWRRTAPYPSMTTFDATSREVCTIRRIRTNTPLQALVTLNDPVFIEASQGLARKVLRDSDGDENTALRKLFWLVLSREPEGNEVTVLMNTLAEAKDALSASPEDARQLAETPLGPLNAEADKTQYAAWTVLANVVLNLDETLSRP